MPNQFSAVLLATAVPLEAGKSGVRAEPLTAEQKSALRASLDAAGAMVAVNNGEYLGIYDRPALALQAGLRPPHA